MLYYRQMIAVGGGVFCLLALVITLGLGLQCDGVNTPKCLNLPISTQPNAQVRPLPKQGSKCGANRPLTQCQQIAPHDGCILRTRVVHKEPIVGDTASLCPQQPPIFGPFSLLYTPQTLSLARIGLAYFTRKRG